MLTPPPVDSVAASSQVTSLEIVLPEAMSVVPPHPQASGDEAGKSTARPVVPSDEPASPEATKHGVPIAAASVNA
jgi:hypothetical protein